MSEYYISVGSNMGDRLAHLRYAAAALAKHGIRLLAKSNIYETIPWGNKEQDLFLNAAFSVEWDGNPENLLRELLAIEEERGRKRLVKWGPRTLDLDLICGNGVTSDTEFLRLPHPLALERAFVLIPLADLNPNLQIGGISVSKRISELNDKDDVKSVSESWE